MSGNKNDTVVPFVSFAQLRREVVALDIGQLDHTHRHLIERDMRKMLGDSAAFVAAAIELHGHAPQDIAEIRRTVANLPSQEPFRRSAPAEIIILHGTTTPKDTEPA